MIAMTKTDAPKTTAKTEELDTRLTMAMPPKTR